MGKVSQNMMENQFTALTKKLWMKAGILVAHGNPIYCVRTPAMGGPSIAPSAQAELHNDEITAKVFRPSAS